MVEKSREVPKEHVSALVGFQKGEWIVRGAMKPSISHPKTVVMLTTDPEQLKSRLNANLQYGHIYGPSYIGPPHNTAN